MVDTDPTVKAAGMGIPSHAASGGVRITGAMGPNSVLVNGIYEATSEMSGDVPVYVKVGYNEVCLEYIVVTKSWQVRDRNGTDLCFAGCTVSAKCLPQERPGGKWKVLAGSKFVPLPTISISHINNEEVDAYREELEREAARELSSNRSLCITGATGSISGFINGEYKPTNEKCGNVTSYTKVGDDNIWLEYYIPLKQWQVKSTEYKNTGSSWACCAVPIKCLPEECPVRKWHVVSDGSNFVPQRAITIALLQGENSNDNDSIAGTGDVDDDETKPKAATMKMDADADAQSGGIGVASPTAFCGVRITGATGPNYSLINGIYEATSEMSGDMPVYASVGGNGMCMEYHAPSKSWQVKLVAYKGKDLYLACCVVPVRCLPEACPVGKWKLVDAYNRSKYVLQPVIVVSLVRKEEVDA